MSYKLDGALFHLATSMIRRRVRGGWRLLHVLQDTGMVGKTIGVSLNEQISVSVPASDNGYYYWGHNPVRDYEKTLVADLGRSAAHLPRPITLIDCGADIGVFSLLLKAGIPGIEQIYAFEPNPEAFPLLKSNLERLGGKAIPCAVGECMGRGDLARPDYDQEEHAAFIAPSDQGSVEVITLDSLRVHAKGLILKMDIEGAELAALHGATQTLLAAEQVLLVLEAHPNVARRTGIDPVELIRFVQSLRPFEFSIAETSTPITGDWPVFGQIRPDQTFNLIGIAQPYSRGESSSEPRSGGRG